MVSACLIPCAAVAPHWSKLLRRFTTTAAPRACLLALTPVWTSSSCVPRTSPLQNSIVKFRYSYTLTRVVNLQALFGSYCRWTRVGCVLPRSCLMWCCAMYLLETIKSTCHRMHTRTCPHHTPTHMSAMVVTWWWCRGPRTKKACEICIGGRLPSCGGCCGNRMAALWSLLIRCAHTRTNKEKKTNKKKKTKKQKNKKKRTTNKKQTIKKHTTLNFLIFIGGADAALCREGVWQRRYVDSAAKVLRHVGLACCASVPSSCCHCDITSFYYGMYYLVSWKTCQCVLISYFVSGASNKKANTRVSRWHTENFQVIININIRKK